MKQRTPWLVGGAVALVALIGGALLIPRGDGTSQPALPAAHAQTTAIPAPSVPVETTQVQKRDVPRLIALPGTIRPFEEATLAAKVPGYLSEVRVDKGSRVRAGQVLAVLRAPELAAESRTAQDAYAAQVAAAQGSRAAYARSVAEEKRSQVGAEKAKADVAEADAGIGQAKAEQVKAEAAAQEAQAQQAKAQADVEEARALLARAEADATAAAAERDLAQTTYARYKGIYDRDKDLIARQDVDTAESKAKAAEARLIAARSQVEAARRRVSAAEALVAASAGQITQAKAQSASAVEQVRIAQAKAASAGKQAEVAAADTAVGRQEVAVGVAQARQAELQAKASAGARSRAGAMADYLELRAPFSGIVTARNADPGALLQGQSSVLTVARLDTMRLVVNVPEAESRFVQPGTPVAVQVTSLPGEAIKATVARTTSALDAKNRTLLTEADLPNPQGRLLAGAYATVKVTLETHRDVLSVPSAAVNNEKAGKSVFVVEGGKAKRVPVTVGFDDGTYTEIVTGLSGGEEVIVTGKDAVTPGAPVSTSPYTGPKKK